MVPDTFTNFFIASVGASAALIGLLFVAITVAPERIFGSESTIGQRAMAGSAFLALLNAFFVSLAALIPDINIGIVATIFSILALFNTAMLSWRIWLEWRQSRNIEGVVLSLGSIFIYIDEIRYAMPLLQHGHDTTAMYGLVYLLLAIYALGVVRAWALLGGGQDGILAMFGIRGKQPVGTSELPASSEHTESIPQSQQAAQGNQP